MPAADCELCVVIVSANSARWLEACVPSVFGHAGAMSVDVVVVDNESSDGTRELVESRLPGARVVDSINRGFGYGNNRGLEASDSPYVLFLNPDTEILEGTLEDLVEHLERDPRIGLVGVRQVAGDGSLWPTIRRFPSVSRAIGEALSSERWPWRPSWAGERVLDRGAYEREGECDWTSGSFMLARRQALLDTGAFDERFFIYSEEPDLCLRLKRRGWSVRHLPQMTILHHAGKEGVVPRLVAQDAYSRKQYAHKHFGQPRRALYLSACAARHMIRALGAGGEPTLRRERRLAARQALRALAGVGEPPFGEPPLASG